MITAIITNCEAQLKLNGTVNFVDENGKKVGSFDLSKMGRVKVLVDEQSMMVDPNTQVCVKFTVCIPQTSETL